MRKKLADEALLYDPAFEKDACGMGFIAQKDGKSSHLLVERALTMLARMNHRGGTGAEPDTGDGAGILMALPDTFFQEKAQEAGIELPAKGEYAVGMLFLPKEQKKKAELQKALVTDILASGFDVLWTGCAL